MLEAMVIQITYSQVYTRNTIDVHDQLLQRFHFGV